MRILFPIEFVPQEMLGAMYLSRALKDAGHQTKAVFFPDPRFLEKIQAWKPDVLAWGPVTTGVHNVVRDMNLLVREKVDAFSVFGGTHTTFVQDFVKEPGIDAICVGEGEYALVELANRLQRGEDVSTIPNLHVKRDGRVVRNEPGPLVKDLDSLGIPDRDVIYDEGALYRDNPRKVFVTQRGCPYSCSFCFHHAWRSKIYKAKNEDYVRKRSVDHVLLEIEHVRDRYPLKFVHFVDDIFNIDDDWLDEFCEKYPKRIGLPYDVILQAALTRREQMVKMRRSGCVSARIAFETANDYLRNKLYRKGGVSYDQLVAAARYIKEAGIRLTSLNILGGPTTTIDDDLETVRLNIDAKVDHPLVTLLQAYPEFDIATMTRDMGYAVDDVNQFKAKFNRASSINLKNRHQFDNLHKLFPLLIRFPWLMPAAKVLVKPKWMGGIYFSLYAMWNEYMVAEQNRLWARELGLRGPRHWAITDWLLRVTAKTTLRIHEKFSVERAKKRALALQIESAFADTHLD